MKNLLLIVAFLLIAKSQGQNLDEGTIKAKEYYAEIPFEYINEKIIIPVVINAKTYRFIFDSGAPNVLTKKLSDQINPNSSKSLSVSDANNNSSKMGIISIPMMTLGNIIFENSSALVFQEEKNIVFDCFEVDGFIGSNLFRNSIIQIDTKNKLLRITNDKKLLVYDKSNPQKVKLVGSQKSPYFKINLGKDNIGEEWVLFDTGMQGFYDLSKKHYEIFKKHPIFKEIASSAGGEGVGMFGSDIASLQHKCLLSNMQIGNKSFSNIEVITTNDDNSRIGSKILKYCIVTLNFKDKNIYFDSYPEFMNTPTIDLTQKSRKISITVSNDTIVVGFVWDETLKSKISAGDKIIAVNTINFDSENLCEIIVGKINLNNEKPSEIIIKTKTGELVTIEN